MNIQTFRNDFSSSRSNRYKITGTMPDGLGKLDDSFTLYAKSVSFPGSQIGMIPVSYQGRVIKFTGERQFSEWSIQVYDVSNSATAPSIDIRTQLEAWIENQLTIPRAFTLESKIRAYHQMVKDSTATPTAGASNRLWDYAWWQYLMTSPDALRQRVAFALSELLVISENSAFNNVAYEFICEVG